MARKEEENKCRHWLLMLNTNFYNDHMDQKLFMETASHRLRVSQIREGREPWSDPISLTPPSCMLQP